MKAITILTLAGLIAINTVIHAQTNIGDSLALVDLYNRTNGPGWYYKDGWLTKDPVNTWYGITAEKGRVTEINLIFNGLSYQLPQSVTNLIELKVLNLTGNSLMGKIPEDIGDFEKLQVMNLALNFFTGGIPESIGDLVNLEVLNLSGAISGGTIPESIGDLSKLTELNLSLNQFTGNIPGAIFNLRQLTSLDISSNLFTGNLPSEIGNLTRLQSLFISGNHLSVSISENIQLLSQLEIAQLDYNEFTGAIPAGIGLLSKLTSLYLSSNQLTGVIPPGIGNLVLLNTLSLSNNKLTGSIPESLCSLSELTLLDLSHNQLTGSIPSSIGNLSLLQSLLLSNNLLSGTIPETTGSLHNLTVIDISSNNISGVIPETIGGLSSLMYMRLQRNKLSGIIPSSTGALTELVDLNLANNQLTGNIPGSFGNLLLLKSFRVSDNYLSGKINADAFPLSLQNIIISDNSFTFDGMEELVKKFPSGTYIGYAPQADIPVHQNGNILSVSAGGILENNSYNWFRGDELVKSFIGDSTYTVSIDGNYSVFVTNATCLQLILYSDTIATGVLPMNLLGFSAVIKSKDAVLNWSTANENHVAYFNIQRSTDGMHFYTAGKVNANGLSAYSFTDANVTALHCSKLYYRLQQADIDGSYTISKTIVLHIDEVQKPFAAYPNPAAGTLHIQTNGKALFILTDNTGKTIISTAINDNGEINVSSLQAGVYYLKNITTGEVQKIIVAR